MGSPSSQRKRKRKSEFNDQGYNQLPNDVNIIKANTQPINDLVNDMQRVKGSLSKLYEGLKEQKKT